MQKESIERSAPENQWHSLVNRILFLLEILGKLRDSEKPLIVKNLNWQKEKKLQIRAVTEKNAKKGKEEKLEGTAA